MAKEKVSLGKVFLLLFSLVVFSDLPSVYANPDGCPSNIIHYWKLDETASPYIDSYGGDSATCTSCPAATTGVINGAQEFNTTTQVNVLDDGSFDWLATDSFSIEFWMKTDPGSTCSGNEVIVGKTGSAGGLMWVGCYDGGTAGFELYDTTGISAGIGGVKVLTDGGWHHVVAVRDASANQIRIYVDGNSGNSQAVSYSTGFDFSAPLNIGWLSSGSGYHFLGSIDEIALYNRALSDVEIQSHYYLVRGYCDMCATPVKIMPLGDSITEGYNGLITDDNYMASYRQKLYLDLIGSGYNVNFVGSLQSGNLLTPAFDTDHEGHAGYSAACTYGPAVVTYVYNWVTANPADVVLLHIGTNDVANNCQSAAGISSVLDQIYSYNRNITVLLARIINQQTYDQAVTDFNDSVEAMAINRIANGDRIILVDQEHALTYPDDMEGLLHPTQAGYDKMAVPWFWGLTNFLPVCNQAAPVFFSNPVSMAAAGQPYTYGVDATGNPTPTYNLNTAPSWMTINANTGLISGMPNTPGSFNATVAASNSVGTVTQSFPLEVVSCPSGMIHYWKLDETGPPYVDFYGADNAACTYCPTATTGILNDAQHFNATAQVNVPDDNTFNWGIADSFSIEFWMKPDPASTCSGNQVVVGRKGNSGGLFWVGCYDGGTAGFELYDKDGNGRGVGGTKSLTDGQWHHVVGVRDGGVNQILIYVDGLLENSVSVTYSTGFDFSVPLNIGWINKVPGFHFLGGTAEVALYSRVLSDSEILQHFNYTGSPYGYCSTSQGIISAAPSSYNFGSVRVGSSSAAQTFTVSNNGGAGVVVGTITLTGTNASEFGKLNDNCSGKTLAPSSTCTIQAIFSPASSGAKVANLNIPSSDPTVNVPLSGTGTGSGSGIISMSPASYDFGSTGVGSTSVAQTFTVSNTGVAALVFGTITVTGANASEFGILNDNCSGGTLAASSTCTVQAVFSPASTGAKSGNLSIPSSAPTDPVNVPLSGTGTGSGSGIISMSPASYDFGSTGVGSTSVAQTFTVSNTGGAALVIGTITVTGANASEFGILNDNCSRGTLSASSTCTVQAVFSPASVGAKSANLSIPSSAPTVNVPLSGTGTMPTISMSPASYDFGSTGVGSTSVAQTFTVSNTGGAALVIGTITVTGTNASEFGILNDNCSRGTLSASSTCTVQAVFSPASVGAKSANLSIPSSAPTVNVPLSGTGTVANQYATTFQEYTTGQQPSDWTANWVTSNSSWTVQAGSGLGGQQLQGDQDSDDERRLLSWNVIPINDPNIEILAKVMSHSTTGGTVARVGLRAGGSEPNETGYFAGLSGGTNLVLMKYVNGKATGISTTNFTWSTGSWYWIRFRANGTSLKVKAWLDGSSEPGAWNIDTTDSDIPGVVGPGWVPDDHTDRPYYDYFSVGASGQTAPSPSAGNLNPSVSPASYDFGSIGVGSTSAAQTFTVSNTGGAALVIGTITVTGANASEFGILNDNCSRGTLSASSTCTVQAVFSPASVGAKSGNLSIPSSAPTVNVPLSGTGTAPNQYATTFQEYTTGQQPSDWTANWVTSNSSWTVQAGSGLGGQQLQGDQDSDDERRLLSWNVIPINDPNIEILAKVMSHSTTGGTVARVGLRAGGSEPNETGYFAGLSGGTNLVLMKYVNGKATGISTTNFTWSTGSWYWIRFRANGTSLKVKAWLDGSSEPGAWNIDTTDSDIPGGGWTGVGTYDHTDRPYYDYFSVGASGQTAPSPSAGNLNPSVSPASYDFGSIGVGSTSAAQTFTVSNTGGAALVIGTITVTGANASEFGILNDNCSRGTLSASSTCTVQAVFSPASVGAKSGNLSIPSSAPTVNVPLSGTGTAPNQYATTFQEYTTGQQPSDWTANWVTSNSSWTVQAGSGLGGQQLQGDQDSDDERRLLSWNVIPINDPDIEILAKVMSHSTTGGTVARVGLRAGGSEPNETGYFAGLSGGTNLVLMKYVNGKATGISTTNFTWSTGSWYWIRFRANGTSLKVKAWLDGSSEPGAWNIDTTDSDIPGGGWTGVGTYDHTDRPYYDYFSVGASGQTAPSP